MAEFKKEIPFQSVDTEFDNFFGLKLGMTLGEALFKVACYGLDIISAFQKGKKITFQLYRKGVTFYSCQVKEMYITFSRKKGKYYLICSEIFILHNTQKEIEALLTDYNALETKYTLKKKKYFFLNKTSKYTIRLVTLVPLDNWTSVEFSKKRAEHIYSNKIHFLLSFLAKDSEEIRPFGYQLDRLLDNYSSISADDKKAIIYLIIGLLQSSSFYNKIEDYAQFWGRFLEFWKKSDNSEKFLELSRNIKQLIEEADPNATDKTKSLIFKTIEDKKNDIIASEEEKKKAEKEAKKAKKEEKEKAKQEEMNKLTASLDDL